jgi:hypothetical protein
MSVTRKTVLVGRVTPGGAEIVVVDGFGTPPFPGPWTLRAMIRIPESPRPAPVYSPTEIH